MDIRQSPEYAQYIKSLGWQVDKLGKWFVFIKKFPLIGSLVKIQRIPPPIPFVEIEKLAQEHRAFQIIIEPLRLAEPRQGRGKAGPIFKDYHPLKSPFIPTKTLIKDLKPTEQEIFASFSKNKRRDIRLAQRNNLTIKEGTPEDFLELKKQYLLRKFILPIGTRREIKNLYDAFDPKAKILIAYPLCLAESPMVIGGKAGQPLAGVFLLFHDKVAYYWQAAATDEGKKLLAPTLLVWEAIKLAKKIGCTKFDFEGIYDERFPQNRSWEGFTHFKEGFRGKEILYSRPLARNQFFRF